MDPYILFWKGWANISTTPSKTVFLIAEKEKEHKYRYFKPQRAQIIGTKIELHVHLREGGGGNAADFFLGNQKLSQSFLNFFKTFE